MLFSQIFGKNNFAERHITHVLNLTIITVQKRIHTITLEMPGDEHVFVLSENLEKLI